MSRTAKTDSLSLGPGVIAICGQGRLGLITEGPKTLVIDGRDHDFYSGVQLENDPKGRFKVGSPWTSYKAKPVCRIEELRK